MMVFANIGPTALYLLFTWLGSAAIASWMTERKGYGERLGLALGLILSAIGLLIVLLLPGRPGSKWKVEGRLPPRRSARGSVASGDAGRVGATDGAGAPPDD